MGGLSQSLDIIGWDRRGPIRKQPRNGCSENGSAVSEQRQGLGLNSTGSRVGGFVPTHPTKQERDPQSEIHTRSLEILKSLVWGKESPSLSEEVATWK